MRKHCTATLSPGSESKVGWQTLFLTQSVKWFDTTIFLEFSKILLPNIDYLIAHFQSINKAIKNLAWEGTINILDGGVTNV